MESLTQMVGENAVPVEFDCDFVLELDDKTYKGLQKIFNRLASIERILGKNYDLDRLRELIQADRDGRCVVLPCKLHDKVFFIENGCVKETEVDSFHNWTSGRWKLSAHTDRMFDHRKGYEIDFSGIGKTVFLTREQAESALNKMKEAESE